MDEDAIIAEVARRHGVLLGRDDPAMIMRTIAEVAAKQIMASGQPNVAALSRGELRAALISALATNLPPILSSIRWAAIIAGAALLVATLLAGFWGGFWWRATHGPVVTEVTDCRPAPQPAGGQAVACTFWIHDPTPTHH